MQRRCPVQAEQPGQPAKLVEREMRASQDDNVERCTLFGRRQIGPRVGQLRAVDVHDQLGPVAAERAIERLCLGRQADSVEQSDSP